MSWPAKGEGWQKEDDATLRELWASGLSCGKIARQMGRTKNSIVGRSHRLQFSARPSPIKLGSKSAEPKPKPKPMALRVTLPPLKSAAVERVVIPLPRPTSSLRCEWLSGNGRPRDFVRCDGRSEIGKPYCLDHCKIAFVRRGWDAA